MKLYNREQFLGLPAGVVFAKYQPCIFGDWQIKGDTWTANFIAQPLASIDTSTFDSHPDACFSFEATGEAGVDYYDLCRDGLFEYKQLYAVLEAHEVRGLIERLEQTLVDGYDAL
jgi:hypothetical protein